METSLTAVTVYPDRARITRTGHAQVQAGRQQVEVPDLPLALISDSVRAAGRGTARAKLLGVSLRSEHFFDTPVEAVQALEARLQAAEEARADNAAQTAILEAERKNLETLGAQSETLARGLALRNQKPEEQGALFDFLRQRQRALQSELLQLAREKRENGKLIDQLRRQLQEVQAARPRQRYIAVVELEVLEPGELQIELTYLVNGARWRPLYDLHLEDGALEVTYLAEVTQTTGEDWLAVALTLSTAQPAVSLMVPKLAPWFVAPPPPMMPVAAARSQPGGGFSLPLPAAMPKSAAPAEDVGLPQALPAPMMEMLTEAAAVSEAGAALTYQLTGRADVPGGGDPRKVTVAVFPLKPALDYVTAPKLQAACFRRAKIKNDSPYTLLAGPAQLFDGADFLGATPLPFTAAGQEVELFLGVDERVRVKRELTLRDVDKNLLGDRRRTRYGYLIEIENVRDSAQTVLVRDQLPVARDEQIKIRLELADPKLAEQTDLNLLEWKVNVGAAAKQKIKFEFTVEHPRSMDVRGLP